MPDYNKTLTYAKKIKNNVETNYTIGASNNWSYYFAKQILTINSNIKQINIENAAKPSGTYVSRQVYKSTYVELAKKLVNYVEKNYQLPNYLSYETQTGKTVKLAPRIYTYMFARILVYYQNNKSFPKYANVNSKCFTKPTETGNEVYDYFVEKTGKKYTKLDDLLGYVQANFTYQYYYDDQKSNKQITDTEAGNCVDLLQWLCNMAEAMGYDWKCMHVQCRQSGTGHVFGKFKKKDSSTWITRDPASVADGGSITSIWCENGYVLAENPSWFLQNINR